MNTGKRRGGPKWLNLPSKEGNKGVKRLKREESLFEGAKEE